MVKNEVKGDRGGGIKGDGKKQSIRKSFSIRSLFRDKVKFIEQPLSKLLESKGKAKVDVGFRAIRTSWTLWLVAVVFTIIISPPILLTRICQGPLLPFLGILIPIFIGGAACGGYLIGKKIIDKYYKDVIIKDEEHRLAGADSYIAHISIIILVASILIMDLVSVAAESYSGLYTWSVILLVITTILLTMLLVWSITKRKKYYTLYTMKKQGRS